jgi:magnesium-transporting ATPase (P-type)
MWSNLPLLGAAVFTVALQMVTVYVPVLSSIFKTKPLRLTEFGLCLLLSSVVLVLRTANKGPKLDIYFAIWRGRLTGLPPHRDAQGRWKNFCPVT